MKYNNKKKKEIKKIENTKRLVIFVIIFSFILIGAFLFRNNQADAAGGITVSGKVYDETDSLFIEGAKVEIYDDSGKLCGTKITNNKGDYTFTDLDSGKYKLKYTTGYNNKTLKYNSKEFEFSSISMPKTTTNKIDDRIDIMFIAPDNANDDYKNIVNDILDSLKDSTDLLQVGMIIYGNGACSRKGLSSNIADIWSGFNSVSITNNPLSLAVTSLGMLVESNKKKYIICLANDNLPNLPGINEDLKKLSKELDNENNCGYLLLTIMPKVHTITLENAFVENSNSKVYTDFNKVSNLIKDIHAYAGIDSLNQKEDIMGDKSAKTADLFPVEADKLSKQEYNFNNNDSVFSRTTMYVYTKEINISKTVSKINVNLKRVDTIVSPFANLPEEEVYDSFHSDAVIKGQVFVEGKPLTGCSILVELINADDDTRVGDPATTNKNTGEYDFSRPDAGEYYIKFTYGHYRETAVKGINGQYYEPDESNIKTVEQLDSRTNNGNHKENSAKEVEETRKNVNNKWTIINNKKTTQLMGKSMDPDEIEQLRKWTDIQAVTNTFTVPDYDGSEDFALYYANLKLKKREEFSIDLEKKLSAVKLTLANGQQYINWIGSELDIPNGNGSGNREDIRTALLDIPEELTHGATVKIEYEITVKNTGTIKEVKPYKIIDYLDFENNAIIYDENEKMITEPTRDNAYYGWKKQGANDFKEYVEYETNNLTKGSTYLLTDYFKPEEYSATESVNKIKLVVSKIISASSTEDELRYGNIAEILMYGNSEGRMAGSYTPYTMLESDIDFKPGNYNPTNIEKYLKELDTYRAPYVVIIPPLGNKTDF